MDARVFAIFCRIRSGQGRGVGPVGKIAHQYGIFFQWESPQPAEDALLFVRADDAAAVEDGAEHAAGAQRRESGFQRRDAAVCCGEDAVVGPPGSQPKLNITMSAVPGRTYCKRFAWLSQISSAVRPCFSSRARVEVMASGWMSKPSTRPSGPARRQRNAVSPPLPQVASMQSFGLGEMGRQDSPARSAPPVRMLGRGRGRAAHPQAAKPNFCQNMPFALRRRAGAR